MMCLFDLRQKTGFKFVRSTFLIPGGRADYLGRRGFLVKDGHKHNNSVRARPYHLLTKIHQTFSSFCIGILVAKDVPFILFH